MEKTTQTNKKALPNFANKITTKVKLPLTYPGKTFKVRAKTAGEEKTLLLAKSFEDTEKFHSVLEDVVSACTFGEVDATKLSYFEMALLILEIECISNSSVLSLQKKCGGYFKDENGEFKLDKNGKKKQCDIILRHDIDLKTLYPDVSNLKKETTIYFDKENTFGITLRQPTFFELERFNRIKEEYSNKKITKEEFEGAMLQGYYILIAEIVTSVFEGENVFHTSELSMEERIDFIENNLDSGSQFIKTIEFINNIPSIGHVGEETCPACKTKSVFSMDGFSDFL